MRLSVDARRPFALAMAALTGFAWLSLWLWGESPYGRFLSHKGIDAAGGGSLLALTFVGGWTLMIGAMMLPSSLPLVLMFGVLTRQRADRFQLLGLLLLGYLCPWAMFGAAIHAGDLGLHAAVRQVDWVGSHAWVIGAAPLVGAGVYQFSPPQYFLLGKYLSPLSLFTQHLRRPGA